MKVKEIMTTKVAFVNPDDKIVEAAKLMQKYNVGSVPVCEKDDSLVGIITDRDIVVRNIAAGNDPFSTAVSSVMTPAVQSVGPDAGMDEATRLMADYQVRRLPVVENSKLVGIVALADIATDNRVDTEASEALAEISKPRKRY